MLKPVFPPKFTAVLARILVIAAVSVGGLRLTAQTRPPAPPAASPAIPWGFRDVYGIELNILEEAGEVELISMVGRNRRGSGGIAELEYSFSRRFSLEAEIPWSFSRPSFAGLELEGTYALVRNDAQRWMLLAGTEIFIPTKAGGELEVEPCLGFIKSFSSFAVLARLSWAFEGREESEINIKDELQPSLSVGPYFRFSDSVFVGLPLSIGKDGDRLAYKSGLDINLQLTPALRLFLLAQAKFNEHTYWSWGLGCFFEID
jgi:hypothetical protein